MDEYFQNERFFVFTLKNEFESVSIQGQVWFYGSYHDRDAKIDYKHLDNIEMSISLPKLIR